MKFTVKKPSPNYTPKKPHFFVLSQGFNAGKPQAKEVGECLIIICDSEEDCRKIAFITEGIWKLQIFRMQMNGSVIPRLQPKEYSNTLSKYLEHIKLSEDRMRRLMEAFTAIEAIQKEVAGLNKILEDYKSIAFRNILRSK